MAPAARWITRGLGAAALALAAVGALAAGDQAGAPAASAPAALTPKALVAQTQPASGPSSEQVMQELMGRREANPLIEPAHRPAVEAVSGLNRPADPMLVGVAPGAELTPLRREGELVTARRGRLLHSPAGHAIFTFEGDGPGSPEPPMIVQPCHMLEEMEAAAQERGDRIVFVVSGQVFTYRGANYLLPTMMHVATDQGNIKH
jgi:hypothetical protein